jgi:hypothetical protein
LVSGGVIGEGVLVVEFSTTAIVLPVVLPVEMPGACQVDGRAAKIGCYSTAFCAVENCSLGVPAH